MNKDFDRSLNDRMEQLPLKELVPGFDRDAEWATLSGKLRPEKKQNLWFPRLAAALLPVLCISWFLIHEMRHRQFPKDKPIVSVPKDMKLPENMREQPPIISASKSETLVKRVDKRKPTTIIKEKQPKPLDTAVVVFQNKEDVIKPLDSSIVIKPEPKTVTAVIKKPRQQALHLLDIANEDRQFIMNEAPLEKHSNRLLNQMFYLLSTPDAVVHADQPYPLEGHVQKIIFINTIS